MSSKTEFAHYNEDSFVERDGKLTMTESNAVDTFYKGVLK